MRLNPLRFLWYRNACRPRNRDGAMGDGNGLARSLRRTSIQERSGGKIAAAAQCSRGMRGKSVLQRGHRIIGTGMRNPGSPGAWTAAHPLGGRNYHGGDQRGERAPLRARCVPGERDGASTKASAVWVVNPASRGHCVPSFGPPGMRCARAPACSSWHAGQEAPHPSATPNVNRSSKRIPARALARCPRRQRCPGATQHRGGSRNPG